MEQEKNRWFLVDYIKNLDSNVCYGGGFWSGGDNIVAVIMDAKTDEFYEVSVNNIVGNGKDRCIVIKGEEVKLVSDREDKVIGSLNVTREYGIVTDRRVKEHYVLVGESKTQYKLANYKKEPIYIPTMKQP